VTQFIDPLHDLTATAVQALTLYCLAEFQSGHASTIRVNAEGASFSVSDNGRGHPIDKTVEGTSYLIFIYTHFDYPFESGRDAPIQLQGIGMSLVNALCSEFQLTVKKPDAELRLLFNHGQLTQTTRTAGVFEETGITVSAKIAPHLCSKSVDQERLEAWLVGVLATAPSLSLFFNGRRLQPPSQRAG
jgi:DNA gyrase/topoisomerase IV subunit B